MAFTIAAAFLISSGNRKSHFGNAVCLQGGRCLSNFADRLKRSSFSDQIIQRPLVFVVILRRKSVTNGPLARNSPRNVPRYWAIAYL